MEKVEVKVESLAKIYEQTEIDTEDEEESFQEEESTTVLTSKLQIKEINDYVLSLKSAAKHWYNTFNPENNNDLTNPESVLLDKLNRIGIGYFRPLVMSSFCSSAVSENDRITLLSNIERFSLK